MGMVEEGGAAVLSSENGGHRKGSWHTKTSKVEWGVQVCLGHGCRDAEGKRQGGIYGTLERYQLGGGEGEVLAEGVDDAAYVGKQHTEG